MTSLPPLLPDSPRLPASDALTGGPAALPAPGAGVSDFAGLVEAFAAPPRAALAKGAIPEAGLGDAPETAVELAVPHPDASPATALATWPTGKTLPEPGALLPPALPPEIPPAVSGEATPALALEASPAATLPGASVPEEARRADMDAHPETNTAPAALFPRATVPARAQHSDVVEPVGQTEPRGADQTAGLAKSALRPAGEDTALPPGEDPRRGDFDDSANTALEQIDNLAQPAALAAVLAPTPPADPALLPQHGAAALTPTSLSDGLAVTASRAATAARLLPTTARAGAAEGGTANPAPRAAPAATASLALPGAELGAGDAAPAPALALAAEAGPAVASDAGSLPDSEISAPAASAPATGTPAANIGAASPLPERPADLRAAAPTASAAPQLESAIAQVGDIREALRSARPAMTLQHAEFGAVSIRLETAAPDQWRAVLASRDPGFVPAIQAALADRAVTAAADTSGNFSGHSGTHQNGTSDQRYGSSPNGGQGSPQPYLGQSGQRDGEAAPDHRRPSTAAALAARGGSEAEDAAASTPGSGGLFA